VFFRRLARVHGGEELLGVVASALGCEALDEPRRIRLRDGDALVVVGYLGEPRVGGGDARRIDPGDAQLGLDVGVDGRAAAKLAREPHEVHDQRRRVLGADGEAEPPPPPDHPVHRLADEASLDTSELARAAKRSRNDRGRLTPITRGRAVDLDRALAYLAVAGGDGDGDAVRRVSRR
jgi:hypothetical protein